MRNKHTISQLILSVCLTILLVACAIPNDIPYPIVEGNITAFEVEGQCDETGLNTGNSSINKQNQTVEIFVSDTVNLSRLNITRFEVSNDATIIPNASACLYPDKFPTKSFSQPSGIYTRVNFNDSVKFTLHTYQDYEWMVKVKQVVIREVEVDNQVGNAIIDTVNHNVIVYVNQNQNLSNIQVRKFTLGGQHGKVIPDPTLAKSYDFSNLQTEFHVTTGWGEKSTWQVFVYQTDKGISTTAEAFARTCSATITGEMANGALPIVEYQAFGESEWKTLPTSAITTQSTTYSAELIGLKPSTYYTYRVSANNSATPEQTFTTASAAQLENSSFDDWSIEGSGKQALYQPWAEGGIPYWDTGNRGATTVGASNSTYVTEGGRTFANLQSKYIVIKFAAGNIFTGKYLTTDGTNGILDFGRPFSSFPTKLQFDYRYKTAPVNRSGKWSDSYANYISKTMFDNMMGQPDSCQIYIMLTDWEEEEYKGTKYPFVLRTRPSELHLMNLKDEHIIAYAQLTQGNDVNEWTTETLTIDYRVKNRTPKYVLMVASSSKYGDYFIGGEGALLQLDNIKLLYE